MSLVEDGDVAFVGNGVGAVSNDASNYAGGVGVGTCCGPVYCFSFVS